MILNQMIHILWQNTAIVANGNTRTPWIFKLKFFELRNTTWNGNALFAENKVYELFNLYNKNKGLICGGLMCEENLNSSCLDYFWNSLLEVVFILNFTVVVFCCHGANAAVTWFDANFPLCILLPKSIYLVYNDPSNVCPYFAYVVSLLFAIFSLVLQKVWLRAH